MILPSTIRKLAAQQAWIYKATKDPFTFQGVTVPEHSQYFTTMKAAQKWLDDGFSTGKVYSETADMATHYMRT